MDYIISCNLNNFYQSLLIKKKTRMITPLKAKNENQGLITVSLQQSYTKK